MIKLEKENYITILPQKQQKYQHNCQVKLINMNILHRLQNITFQSKPINTAGQIYLFPCRKSF